MYSRELKLIVVEKARRTSIANVARDFHLSRNTVRKWVDEDRAKWQIPKQPKPQSILDEEAEP